MPRQVKTTPIVKVTNSTKKNATKDVPRAKNQPESPDKSKATSIPKTVSRKSKNESEKIDKTDTTAKANKTDKVDKPSPIVPVPIETGNKTNGSEKINKTIPTVPAKESNMSKANVTDKVDKEMPVVPERVNGTDKANKTDKKSDLDKTDISDKTSKKNETKKPDEVKKVNDTVKPDEKVDDTKKPDKKVDDTKKSDGTVKPDDDKNDQDEHKADKTPPSATTLSKTEPPKIPKNPAMKTHYWTFDNANSVASIKDSISNKEVKVYGRLSASLTTVGEKRFNKFLQLEDKSSLNLGKLKGCASNIDSCKNGFTLAFWLRQKLELQEVVIIGNMEPRRKGNGFRLMSFGPNFSLTIKTKSASRVFTYEADLGKWKYHVIIWDGNKNASVYVDNIAVKTYNLTPEVGNKMKTLEAAPLRLGWPKYPINADFDDISFWDGALAPEEIIDVYTSSLGMFIEFLHRNVL